ncbi:glycosyltransferase family 4 protein [Rhizobium rhizogenes]|uniref:glycosyltransferase family 4 protein n=1 Tax=Rhizobium rhizogenes TaxID=359 RepID=UPI001573BDDC|nr:glycosyltransferase family 1 protein [Rhizobium rhizogenes]NTF50348.1 glycosyltransferase family 4 protein [Rhizobium rhizogenes]NTH07728.1 glycosyltransferase family 4 protein [Rhizobium rhizogenes]
MRIGVDARNLVHNITGISRYLLETCRVLSVLGHEIILYLPEKPKADLPEIQGAVTRIANYRGGSKRMVWGQTVLPYLAKRDKVDVFWGPAHRLPSFLDNRIPRVVTIHDLVWHHAASTMRLQGWFGDRYLMSPAINTADRVVAVSQATATSVSSMFPRAKKKLRVIYPGLTSLLSDGSDAFLEQNRISRPFALFIGTLEPRKNLLRLLEAYARLPDVTKQKMILVIAGGTGWHMEGLRSYITHLQIDDFVHLTGYVSDENLSTLYRNARLLAMPSIYEGFGFPIVEAHAMGVPVITSNCSSMPEVAGNAALLVNPLDTANISEALNSLAVDDNLHAQLSRNARLNASRFNWSNSTRDLIKIFGEAIAERRQ